METALIIALLTMLWLGFCFVFALQIGLEWRDRERALKESSQAKTKGDHSPRLSVVLGQKKIQTEKTYES